MDSAKAYRLALEKRNELQTEARAMGIDEMYISILVETFYAKIRHDPQIGPVFERVVKDNWAPHLAKMKSFWTSVILRTGEYKGKPMVVHSLVKGAEKQHFDIWLNLFEETLRESSPSPEATDLFLSRAKFMAPRLMIAMFGASL
jgi:hemoglobin